MRFVYAIGFKGDRYLMVHNSRRNGWEMPGGHIEAGETPEQAAEREYIEESGFGFIPVARYDVGEVAIFAGMLGPRVRRGEMRWWMFRELPSELAFPDVEYRETIEWARKQLSDSDEGALKTTRLK